MAAIENFILRFKVEGKAAVDAVKSSITGLKSDIEDLGQVSGPLGNTINGIIGKLGPLGFAASAAAGAFAALGMKAITMADDLQDLADATGLTASEISSFKTSVIDAGGAADDYQQMLQKFTIGTQEAAAGNEKFKEAFKALGVYVMDSTGKVRDSRDIFQDILSKFQSGEINAKQYAAAVDLLGKDFAKLDPTKLQAINDPFKDEQIKQLAKYQSAIDALVASVQNNLIKVFGDLAIYINNARSEANRLEEEANKKGRTRTIPFLPGNIPAGPRSGSLFERQMSEDRKAEIAAENHLKNMKEIEAEVQAERERQKRKQTAAGGSYGGISKEQLEREKKAREEWEKRTEQSKAEIRRLSSISLFDEIANIELQKTADIEKAKIEIMARADLNKAKKAEELALKTQEIELKAANDIKRIRDDTNRALDDQMTKIKRITEDRQTEFDLLRKTANLSADAAAKEQKIADIEKQRKLAIEEAAKIKNIDIGQLSARIEFINAEADAQKKLTEQVYEYQRSFEYGWGKAFASYMEDSTKASRVAENMFTSMTSNMNSALDRFVETGKLNFSDLATSIIQDIVKIQLRAAAANLFAAVGGQMGQIFGITARASGGPVNSGQPYIVGEKGPELFLPQQSGTIIPNNQIRAGRNGAGAGNTVVNYNIQAVDALSFKQLVARDPSFIYAVTEQGKKAIPSTRR